MLFFLRLLTHFGAKIGSLRRHFDKEVEKVKRQANWTVEKCLFLVTAVKNGFAVVKRKFGPCLTSKMKKDRWERISQHLSAQFGSNRTQERRKIGLTLWLRLSP